MSCLVSTPIRFVFSLLIVMVVRLPLRENGRERGGRTGCHGHVALV